MSDDKELAHAEMRTALLKHRARKLANKWASEAAELSPEEDGADVGEHERGMAMAYWACAAQLREEFGV